MLVALAAIVATRIEPQLLEFPFRHRARFANAMAHRADGEWWQYAQFIRGVREHTQPGDTIAVIVPVMRWDDGYSYAYYRASYFLSGREVLPLIDGDGRTHPENFAAAKYVAVWRARIAPRGTVVWSGDGGVLTRHR